QSKVYDKIFQDTKALFAKLFLVPDNYKVLFLQGGASSQFSMVPLNLMAPGECADYAVTGNFAKIAAKEAAKYGTVNIAADTSDCNHTRIPTQEELKLDPNAKYFYYCGNNTIFGTEWHYIPEVSVPLVTDMSSDILTKPLDVSKFGIIFAGAQKNLAPAGGTLVIIDKSLAGPEQPVTPLMMSYQTMINKDSMYNTPPCYNIYMLGLMMKWIKKQGGLEAMDALRHEKSSILYNYLDESKLFIPCAEKPSRSFMNVTFNTGDADKDAAFCKAAAAAGFVNLKGHRLVGGMRASIYNAVPIDAVKALVEFMKDYEVKNRV
ncbi:MAG: 3-phosphoserine/phosphohydroxythreonine transaminase, partial [Oscillospiraceae bacterium]|nr:3-phosphoserine/phosphohydroxythreonine transaminase [Oscillospiraceae bacterium]